MTHSGLTTGIQITSDSGNRTGRIDRFIVHHAAGTSLPAILGLFRPGGKKVSANYALKDNQLILAVDENRRAFTSASAEWDGRAVTIEVANSSAGGSWPVSDASFHTLARLIADVSTRYGFPINDETILTHQEIWKRYRRGYATACPGDLQRRKAELINLARSYAGSPAVPGVVTPAPSTGGTGGSAATANGSISVDGDFGPQTIRKLQYALGYRAAAYLDGQFGTLTKKKLQSALGQVADGNFGPVSVRALQAYLGTTVDGNWGSVTTRALQTRLNAGTFNPGGKAPVVKAPAAAAPSGIPVDGSFGPVTVKALQRALGQVQDGSFGPVTKKALQRKLGQVADGNFGPVSTKALQRHLGQVADGNWGPVTTRALQSRLNAGTF